ncbi:hypothetical protein [Streptomyces sp. NPDC013187]|uniref:hypothetical protein n=1 Tax=Streptomyces sp. NPDC013187 TaxID=3364865 RepID=UPI0036B52BC2
MKPPFGHPGQRQIAEATPRGRGGGAEQRQILGGQQAHAGPVEQIGAVVQDPPVRTIV